MGSLRVIAVENVIIPGTEELESVMACVYQNGIFYVYDKTGDMYITKEYFDDIESLEYYISKGQYSWVDFSISKGQLIYRDHHGNILVEGERIDEITPLTHGMNSPGDVTLELFYEFLKTTSKDDDKLSKEIKQSFENGGLRINIENILQENPLRSLTILDKKLIVNSRLFGGRYIINYLKELFASDEVLKKDKLLFIFTRIFKLECQNFISIK